MAPTFLKARWENIIMANYVVHPDVLTPYLPHGLQLDLFEQQAMVSLVGFRFAGTRLFSVPIPFFGTFAEINLRFYVVRNEAGQTKRGVVFINETVPHRPVALLANLFYQEHYTCAPTSSYYTQMAGIQRVKYQWKIGGRWQHIGVQVSATTRPLHPDTIESFIYEHYYGYTGSPGRPSMQYTVQHPAWLVNDVISYRIDCDFEALYGKPFRFLNEQTPHSVLHTPGSAVTIPWKRKKIQI